MKKITFILILLITFISQSCRKANTEATDSVQVTVIADITDPHFLLPAAGPIIRLYGFDTDKNTEGFFRLCPLTDKHLNPAIEYHLPPGSVTEKDNTLDDPNYREKVVLTFYQAIRKATLEFNGKVHLDSSLNHSECFSAIAEELQFMKQKATAKNVLLVFSDLQENSDLFNCYSTTNQELLRRRPDKIIALFNSAHLLPDSLTGIKIIFVYEPVTRPDDQRFGAMIAVYKKLLESRGATVKVQADNNYIN